MLLARFAKIWGHLRTRSPNRPHGLETEPGAWKTVPLFAKTCMVFPMVSNVFTTLLHLLHFSLSPLVLLLWVLIWGMAQCNYLCPVSLFSPLKYFEQLESSSLWFKTYKEGTQLA